MSSYREFRMQSSKRRRRRKLQKAGLALLIFALLCVLAGFIVWIIEGPSEKPASSEAESIVSSSLPEADTSAPDTSEPEASSSPAPTVSQSDLWTQVENAEKTINNFEMVGPSYKMFSVPENGKASLSYFEDAVFFGDSITTGWRAYPYAHDLGTNAKVVAEISVSPPVNGAVWQASRNSPAYDPIVQVYSYRPKKIYMMFGTNMLVNQNEATEDKLVKDYAAVIDLLRERLPDVEIYVQSILYPTEKGTRTRPGLSYSRITRVNNRLAAMAASKGCYYLDLNGFMAKEGVLNWDIAAGDGIHVAPDGYRAWLDYLQRHTVYRSDVTYLEEPTVGQEVAVPMENPATRWEDQARQEAELGGSESTTITDPVVDSSEPGPTPEPTPYTNAPQNFLVAAGGPGQVGFNWLPVVGASGYRIYRFDTETGEYTRIAEPGPDTNSLLVENEPAGEWDYRIRAVFSADGKDVLGDLTEEFILKVN